MDSHVQYEGEQNQERILYGHFQSDSKPPKVVRFLIEHGIVQSENQAAGIVLFACGCAVVFSLYFFGFFGLFSSVFKSNSGLHVQNNTIIVDGKKIEYLEDLSLQYRALLPQYVWQKLPHKSQ